MSSTTTQCPEQGEKKARCQLDIGHNVYVMANEWNGDITIHIRKYDSDKGKTFPTKRGIALTLKHWIELSIYIDKIEESIAALKDTKDYKLFQHIGANVHVSVDKNIIGVDIRQWWWCEESQSMKPSRKGIFLSLTSP